MNKTFLSLLICMSVLGAMSCEEQIPISQVDLEGVWNVVEAKRNRKVTKTLRGAWIKFEGMDMTDNFISDEKMYPFILGKNKLHHKNSTEQTYRIKKWHMDTLILTSKIESHRFEFLLIKEKVGQ